MVDARSSTARQPRQQTNPKCGKSRADDDVNLEIRIEKICVGNEENVTDNDNQWLLTTRAALHISLKMIRTFNIEQISLYRKNYYRIAGGLAGRERMARGANSRRDATWARGPLEPPSFASARRAFVMQCNGAAAARPKRSPKGPFLSPT